MSYENRSLFVVHTRPCKLQCEGSIALVCSVVDSVRLLKLRLEHQVNVLPFLSLARISHYFDKFKNNKRSALPLHSSSFIRLYLYFVKLTFV